MEGTVPAMNMRTALVANNLVVFMFLLLIIGALLPAFMRGEATSVLDNQ
jgi:hypothetical protein